MPCQLSMDITNIVIKKAALVKIPTYSVNKKWTGHRLCNSLVKFGLWQKIRNVTYFVLFL